MLGVGCQGKARRVLTYRDLQVRQTAMDWALESYKLAGLIKSSTRTRKLEFRGHGAHAKHVILSIDSLSAAHDRQKLRPSLEVVPQACEASEDVVRQL